MKMSIDKKVENVKKVLCVEDTEFYRDIVEYVVGRKNHPYHFEIASTKEEGLNKINKQNYDLVITDGVLHDLGHSESSKDAMQVGGLEIAMAAKKHGAYVIGYSSEAKLFQEVAGEFLDFNLNKRDADLIKLRECVYNALGMKYVSQQIK